MAKKKIGKGAGARDTAEMSKSEIRAYHKEICEFYEVNGWRTTLSQYLLSPSQAGEITKKTRERMEKAAEKEKAAKAKARAAKKGAKATPSKKKVKKKAAAKKAPPKPAKLKEKATKKAAKKPKRGRPPGRPSKKTTKKVTRRKATATVITVEEEAAVLDYLLAYRRGSEIGVPLDTVIADLASRVRA